VRPRDGGAAPVAPPVVALRALGPADHAAIYGYGVAGARLSGGRQRLARRLWEAHRTRRDQLRSLVTQRGGDPVAADPAYRLPFPVRSARSAAQLAAALEDGVTAAYLGLAGVADPRLRAYAAMAMQEAATRAAQWRGSVPSAFPGLPPAAVQPPSGTGAAG
jgi:hypothetical protein